MFQIGAFALLAGVTAKALRHYDRLGLFRPAWVDPSSGYRWYSPAQLPEVRRIVALRDVGVPLSEVADLVAGGADLGAVLRRRRDELELGRRTIEQKLAALDITVEMADTGLDVVVRTVPAERIASISADLGPKDDLEPLFDELEATVRDRGARAHRPPGAVIHARRSDGGRSVEVWVPVTGSVEQGRVSTRRLEETRAAAAIHRGPYRDLAQVRRDLDLWVERSGLERAGPERIVYLQFGADPDLRVPEPFLAEGSGDFLTEVQIPVV